MTRDSMDQHFRVRQVRFNPDHLGKWYAASRDAGYLCANGATRLATLGEGLLADAVFETYADLEAAHQLWLKKKAE